MQQTHYQDLLDEFNRRLLEIESKYIEFFKNREPMFESDNGRDHLHNHWVLSTEHHRVKFGFANDSDLPDYIRDECLTVFNEVYNNDESSE